MSGSQQAPAAGITIARLKEQAGQVREHHRWLDVANGIADGLVALFVDGQDQEVVSITCFPTGAACLIIGFCYTFGVYLAARPLKSNLSKMCTRAG
jgi:hypothetical protein